MGKMDIPTHLPVSPERLKEEFDLFFNAGGIRRAFRADHRGLPSGGFSPWGLTEVPFVLLNVSGRIDVGFLNRGGIRRDIVLRDHEAFFFVSGSWMDCDNFGSKKYLRITLDTDHTLFGIQDRTGSFPWKEQIPGSMELYACPKARPQLCEALNDYLEHADEDEFALNRRITSALSLMTLHLADMLSQPPERSSGKAETTWMAVRAYVDHHSFNPQLCRKSVAAAFRITESHVSRLFADHARMSYQHYVERRRMVRARMLLVRSHSTVAEIAHACGFGNASYFVRVFHKSYGMPPAGYRAVIESGRIRSVANLTQRSMGGGGTDGTS
jgi:AraC-like DNA-binding protein